MTTGLSLEAQVAQLFMVGFPGTEPGPVTQRFLAHGVGGVIFFRDNFQPLTHREAVRDLLSSIRDTVPGAYPRPFLGIDQEGGQVERLPHTLFPTGLTPLAVALSSDPDRLAHRLYATMARHLAALGFNLNFFPTLDVNLNHRNPIIGVRAFGDRADTVWPLAEIAMRALTAEGILAVGKHFPGHGNGTVDSHLDLPVLHFTQEELTPFRQAVQAGIPAMLVAHGRYPALQDPAGETDRPSSASPAIIQGLLRRQLGFEGVTITDDMCMGAITRHRDAIEAALMSLEAGVDILLYKQSTDAEWAVYEAVCEAFRSGRLPITQLEASVARIQAAKRRLRHTPRASEPEEAPVETLADSLALAGIRVLSQAADGVLPLPADAALMLIHPDRALLGNYAFDQLTSPELDAVLLTHGFRHVHSVLYRHTDAEPPVHWPSFDPAVVVMMTFNPLLYPGQVALYNAIRQRYPNARRVVVSAGTAYDAEALSDMHTHIALCNYRPASMRALARFLFTGPAAP